ncbi:MAG: OmpA family protein [Crocinitomicaceae bacterium]|nr:OmpA family protein [Crocinitomicaceae bacterium]
MKFVFLLFALLYSLSTFSQMNFNGIWQGIITRDGAKMNESNIFFLEIATVDKNLTGRSREELNKTDFYVVQKLKGTILDSITFKFKQYVIEAKKNNPKITWTPIEGKLTFDTLTGYLSGTYTNLTGRKSSGKIIMYRSNATFSNNDMIMLHQSWRDVFIQDLHQKRKAPIIRDWERKNFVFEPIYFDYDKDILKEEYFTYLADMTRVVLDHTDLRIKITGHTDADGSDIYNKDLSARRAKAIQDFFIKQGLPVHKLVIDFKGEAQPVDNNKTEDGKQRNRRVDFEFI